tara:strand:+ start:332 stop:1186 length:855 start_codon:yes stop_codon:yes gene_type:complete
MDYEEEIKFLSDVPESFNLEQYIIDAGIDIVNNVAKFIPQDLNMFTTAVPINDNSGVNFETGLVHFVERQGKTCIEISTEKKNQALDPLSLDYAHYEYPVFYRENKKLYVLPEPENAVDYHEDHVPLFKMSNIEYTEGKFLTDVLLSSSSSSSAMLGNSVKHNLSSGDIVNINANSTELNNSDHGQFSGSNLNIIRVSSKILTIGVEWPGDDLDNNSDWDSIEVIIPNMEFYGKWYYDATFNYKFQKPVSLAHIVNLPSTKGRATSVENLFYKFKTDTFEYISS